MRKNPDKSHCVKRGPVLNFQRNLVTMPVISSRSQQQQRRQQPGSTGNLRSGEWNYGTEGGALTLRQMRRRLPDRPRISGWFASSFAARRGDRGSPEADRVLDRRRRCRSVRPRGPDVRHVASQRSPRRAPRGRHRRVHPAGSRPDSSTFCRDAGTDPRRCVGVEHCRVTYG